VISVVIRAKDESAWLGRCLTAIRNQTLPAEIVAVDNESTDGSGELCRRHGCTVLSLSDSEFSFGRALNQGIAASSGEYVAILSAHCVPLNDMWLHRLAANFRDPQIAGVYGRQEPLPDSTDFDKRDLWTTFGVERRVQRRDFFFHNANAMIRRSVWDQIPFDETLSGVEDRVWAREVIAAGHVLVYEPAASVYHHHGIHQGRDVGRARRVVKVIELIRSKDNESR
jgi:glycosyltransferase involved in cell wall biosynthesis